MDLGYEEMECPTCGVMAPKKQIKKHGQCERHIIKEFDNDRNDEEVMNSFSIIEEKWKPEARRQGVDV